MRMTLYRAHGLSRRSTLFRRLVKAATATAVAASLLAAAACDGTDAGAGAAPPTRGGTLQVSLVGWPNYLDPQLIQAALESNISRLMTRTLTNYRAEPGQRGSEVVPDLATDTGRPTEDNTVWEFTLKDNVRWEDGEPVTCQHVKYGVERRFSQLGDRQGGARYPLTYLRDNDPPYKGPWVEGNNEGRGLASVECVDQHLIRFYLTEPRGDFNYTVSMPVFAPVRPGTDDDRGAYNRRPLSNGPYLVEEHVYDADSPQDNRLVLARNPHWDPATDPNRLAYPDRIVFTPTADVAATTNGLINDQGEDRNRILLDADLAPTFLQQVMTDPALSARVADGPMGAVRYLAVNTERLARPCRQALAYAINKRKFRSTMGGSLLGELATSMIPPTLLAYHEFDHYGTVTNPDGQPERAQEILAEAESDPEVSCPTEITFAYPDTAEIRRLANTVVESYQRIGIRVRTEPIDQRLYFGQLLGERHGDFDLSWMGWVPDWPNASSVIPPLFDGRSLGRGSYNLSYLNSEAVNNMIDDAFAEGDLERQYRLWGELDSVIQEEAATIPLMYTNALRMHGSNVAGGFIHPRYAMPDLAALGLRDPARSGAAEG